MARVLVTGGSGFIGTNAIAHLRQLNDDVLNFDIAPPADRRQQEHFRRVDLCDRTGLIAETAAWRPDVVLHLGACTNFNGVSPTIDYAANIAGVSNMIEAIDAAGSVRHAVFASTRLVQRIDYQGKGLFDYLPTNAYGESKAIGEQLVIRHGPRDAGWTIVRPTSVWGPWFNDPNRPFFEMIGRGLYVHPGHHNPPKQYSYVENAVAQLVGITEAPRELVHRQTFYLTDYEPIRLQDWADDIQRTMNARPIRTAPSFVLRTAALLGDAVRPFWPRVPLTSFRWHNLITAVLFDIEPLRRAVPDLPFNSHEGVERTIAWMRSGVA